MDRAARACWTLSVGLIWLFFLAGCQPGPNSSSSSHWISCSDDSDCSNLPVTATCSKDTATAGYCVDESGAQVERLPQFEMQLTGSELETSLFRFETGTSIRNDELQAYTDSTDNVFVENGELVLRALNEQYDSAEYTSGSVELTDPVSFGRIEASIRSDVGSGVKPVFWLLPADPGTPRTTCIEGSNCVESTWPVWGGIVVMSGRADESALALASYATEESSTGTLNLNEQVAQTPIGPTMSEDFHLYAIEWGPERIDWFIDDELVHSFDLTSPEIHHPDGKNPFHQPFRIKLNLSVGGLVEDPVAADYPLEMRIRSLRTFTFQ